MAAVRVGGSRTSSLRVLAIVPPRLGHLYPLVPTLSEAWSIVDTATVSASEPDPVAENNIVSETTTIS